jgi:hypothetical protein
MGGIIQFSCIVRKLKVVLFYSQDIRTGTVAAAIPAASKPASRPGGKMPPY